MVELPDADGINQGVYEVYTARGIINNMKRQVLNLEYIIFNLN